MAVYFSINREPVKMSFAAFEYPLNPLKRKGFPPSQAARFGPDPESPAPNPSDSILAGEPGPK